MQQLGNDLSSGFLFLDGSSPFHAYTSMHTAVLPRSFLSMRSYTSWAPTTDRYAFHHSFAAPADIFFTKSLSPSTSRIERAPAHCGNFLKVGGIVTIAFRSMRRLPAEICSLLITAGFIGLTISAEAVHVLLRKHSSFPRYPGQDCLYP